MNDSTWLLYNKVSIRVKPYYKTGRGLTYIVALLHIFIQHTSWNYTDFETSWNVLFWALAYLLWPLYEHFYWERGAFVHKKSRQEVKRLEKLFPSIQKVNTFWLSKKQKFPNSTNSTNTKKFMYSQCYTLIAEWRVYFMIIVKICVLFNFMYNEQVDKQFFTKSLLLLRARQLQIKLTNI